MNRKFFDILKFIAIISVLSAHTSPIIENSNLIARKSSLLLEIFGIFGVPIFFFISGFLFNNSQKKFSNFVKKRTLDIVLPWIFVESIVWFYVVIRNGDINFYSWFNFILGFGHSTYYLSMLCLYYIIFWKLKNNKVVMILIMISYAFLLINTQGVFSDLKLHPFMNPLAWSAYFLLGVYTKRKALLEEFIKLSRKVYVYIFIFLSAVLTYLIYFEIKIFYWSLESIIIIPIFFISILFPVYKLSLISNNMTSRIGSLSFTIYLTHELLAGLVIFLFEYFRLNILTIFRPVFLLFIVYAIIEISISIFSKKRQTLIILYLFGVRENLVHKKTCHWLDRLKKH